MNTSDSRTVQLSTAGVIWLQLSVVYLIVGVGMGIAMGASHDFTLRPVHAHINLLGWATMALAGLVYTLFPAAAASKLARLHFWLHNISLPLFMLMLGLVVQGNLAVVPVLVIAQFLAAASVLVFAANLFINLKR
ncbi:MAG TPA: hypothetical protein VIT92_02015 [Burkholderiaceae bacterium]